MEEKTKEVVVVECNGTPYRFENCKVTPKDDRILCFDKTNKQMLGNFPTYNTFWYSVRVPKDNANK
jgi:hypothetical protein